MWERMRELNTRLNDLPRKAAIVLVMLGLVAALSLLLPYVAPFVVAVLLAAIIEPLVRLISRLFPRLRAGRAIASGICTVLLLAILLFTMLALSSRIFTELRSIAVTMPRTVSGLVNAGMRWLDDSMQSWDLLDYNTRIALQQQLIALGSSITSASSTVASSLARGLWNTATVTVPQMILFITLTLMSTFYLSSDKDRVLKFLRSLIPASAAEGGAMIKANLFRGLFGQLRAQLILMLITFAELSIGFSLIKIDYILLLAMIIAVLDAMPIFGTGLFLIPMSVTGFFMQNFRMGVGSLLLYLIIGVVRQTLEPRLIGHSIGLHPLATMMSMYASFRAVGFAGMIIGPILLLIVKSVLKYMTDEPVIEPSPVDTQALREIVITLPKLAKPKKNTKRKTTVKNN